MFIQLIVYHKNKEDKKNILITSFDEDKTCSTLYYEITTELLKRGEHDSITFALKHNGKRLDGEKTFKAEGLKDGDEVELVMLETPKTRTMTEKSQKYTLDFVVDDDYLITLPGFYDTMQMKSMKNLVAKKLNTTVGEIDLYRLNEEGKSTKLSASDGYLEKEVSIYDTLFVKIRENSPDRDKIITAAREMVEAPIDKISPIEKFETVDDFMKMYGGQESIIPSRIPRKRCFVYLLLIKASVLTARTFWEIMRCVYYVGNSKSQEEDALQECMDRHCDNPQMNVSRETHGLVVFEIYTEENCAPFENCELMGDAMEARLGLLKEDFAPGFFKNQGSSSPAVDNVLMQQLAGPEKLREILERIQHVVEEHNYVA